MRTVIVKLNWNARLIKFLVLGNLDPILNTQPYWCVASVIKRCCTWMCHLLQMEVGCMAECGSINHPKPGLCLTHLYNALCPSHHVMCFPFLCRHQLEYRRSCHFGWCESSLRRMLPLSYNLSVNLFTTKYFAPQQDFLDSGLCWSSNRSNCCNQSR